MLTNQDESITHLSLLLRIRQNDRDATAWRDFVDRYGYRIYSWCLNRNLQAHDAEDITQEVLIKLARQLGSFEYDANQSFRGWLRRVTENVLNDFFRQRSRREDNRVDFEQLSDVAAKHSLISELEAAFDLELFELAVRSVQQRVSSERFAAWHRIACKGEKASDVAAELNMKIATVYTAKGQIQALIRDELARLDRLDSNILTAPDADTQP